MPRAPLAALAALTLAACQMAPPPVVTPAAPVTSAPFVVEAPEQPTSPVPTAAPPLVGLLAPLASRLFRTGAASQRPLLVGNPSTQAATFHMTIEPSGPSQGPSPSPTPTPSPEAAPTSLALASHRSNFAIMDAPNIVRWIDWVRDGGERSDDMQPSLFVRIADHDVFQDLVDVGLG